jgi:hypothetical protein
VIAPISTAGGLAHAGGGDRLRLGRFWIGTLRGRDKSLHAFDKYTELKATWINLAR